MRYFKSTNSCYFKKLKRYGVIIFCREVYRFFIIFLFGLAGLEGVRNDPNFPDEANLEFFNDVVSLISNCILVGFFGDPSYPS